MGGGGRRAGGMGGRRPVIVSLALAKLDQPVRTTSGEDEEDQDEAGESEMERERFAGIMGMIAEWSGE